MTDVPPLLTRQCPKCAEWKTDSDFQKSHFEACKPCMSAKRRAAYSTPEARKRRRELAEERRSSIKVPDEQLCTRCNVVKPWSEFYKNRRRLSGLTVNCAACMKERQSQKRADPDYRVAQYLKDKASGKGRRQKLNPERLERQQRKNKLKSLKLRLAVEICQRLAIDLDALVKERLDELRTEPR